MESNLTSDIEKGILDVLRKANGNPLSIKSIRQRLKRRNIPEEYITGQKLARWLKAQPNIIMINDRNRTHYMLIENVEKYLDQEMEGNNNESR
jgi:SRSO17 transposase